MNDVDLLYNKSNYLIPIDIYKGFIYEYDLSKANISALLYTNTISQEEYNRIYNMDKSFREYTIGMMIKNNQDIYEKIKYGISVARKQFIIDNRLNINEIISIKNDAVFTTRKCEYTNFYNIFNFNLKNTYALFLKLENLEIYYNYYINKDNEIIDIIDVKGISDEKLLLHRDGIINIINETCYDILNSTPEETLRSLSDKFRMYIQREYKSNYYRSFDSSSDFVLHTMTHTFRLEYIDENMKYAVNIDRNILILRDLMQIVSKLYYENIKKR